MMIRSPWTQLYANAGCSGQINDDHTDHSIPWPLHKLSIENRPPTSVCFSVCLSVCVSISLANMNLFHWSYARTRLCLIQYVSGLFIWLPLLPFGQFSIPTECPFPSVPVSFLSVRLSVWPCIRASASMSVCRYYPTLQRLPSSDISRTCTWWRYLGHRKEANVCAIYIAVMQLVECLPFAFVSL